MRILLLSDCLSTHSVKWANSLSKKGIKIYLFSINQNKLQNYSPEIEIITPEHSFYNSLKSSSLIKKSFYFTVVPLIRKIIKTLNPDIVHAHYASSYGLLGALSDFHPLIVSVWGSDIFEFPYYYAINKKIIKYVLKKADVILATSQAMADDVVKFSRKSAIVTPFGVDINTFKPVHLEEKKSESEFRLTTIKSLEPVYGIDILIKTFKKLKEKFPALKLKLVIIGKGSGEGDLKELTQQLNLSNDIEFKGYVNPKEIYLHHQQSDLTVFLSRLEGFGVSLIEAMACGKCVVASNVGGHKELVQDGINGFLVPPEDIDASVNVLEKVIKDDDLRKKVGIAARKTVEEKFDWNNNVQQMIRIYDDILSKKLKKS